MSALGRYIMDAILLEHRSPTQLALRRKQVRKSVGRRAHRPGHHPRSA